jgi:GT2 family glycosyltransferase
VNDCFMIQTQYQGAIVVRRTAAIGDSLSATVVAQKLNALGYPVTWQTHPLIEPVIKRVPSVQIVSGCNVPPMINLDGAYENDPQKRSKHFSQVWIDKANQQLRRLGIDIGPPTNCRPEMRVRANDRAAMRARFAQYPRPWVMVCPRSDSYNVRQVPDGIWAEAAKRMIGTKFWLGRHPAPPGFVDLKVGWIDQVVDALSVADLYVGVDTGPLHIAAALGVPVVGIGQSSMPDAHLSDQRDFVTISPNLGCLHCMENQCPKSRYQPPCQAMPPELIADWANARANWATDGGVSAVVPTFRAQVQKLNHCLENLLPQVNEIIVTREEKAIMPAGALQHPKIRYVMKGQSGIGFGRNVNFGARQTNHQWLLIVNDDCFINPGCVGRMLKEAKSDTGILTPLLRYPNGRIFHAGKARQPGARGWEHLDHNQFEHRYKVVTELENACGCVFLMPRKVFYEAGGYNEDYFCYSEDDQLCMDVRRCGYRILFVPYADGIHEGGQTTRMVPGIIDIVKNSNAIFAMKWGRYLDHNATRVPLGNFDYETA